MAVGNPDLQNDDFQSMDEQSPDVTKVAADTGYVFKGFLLEALTTVIEKEGEEGDLQVADFPNEVVKKLRAQEVNTDEKTDKQQLILLGRSLADQGDAIQVKYHQDFVDMVRLLNPSDQSIAYEQFRGIARRLFAGGINFSRIIALFYFGYEIALHVINKGVGSIFHFITKIVKLIVEFVLKEQIACWINRHGGWMSALNTSSFNSELWIQRGTAMLVILAVSFGIYSYLRSSKS